jgi:membrane protein
MLESPLVKVLLKRGRRAIEWLRWLWNHIVAIALRTDEDHVFMLAAGIAFNIITSLVPTILLVLFVLGYVLDSDTIMRQLNEWASTFIVTQGYRQDFLENVQAQITVVVQNRGITGAVGIVGLLWSASALAASIRVSVNKVLRCREVRNYFIYKLYDFLAIMMIGLLVFVSVVTGPLLQLLMAASDRVGLALHLVGIESFVSDLVNFAITLLLFYVIFRYVPYQRQERHIIWIGTAASTALWELARYVFSFYLNEFGTLGRVYGTYAFFAAAALWIYFSSLVFLLGAEVAYHIKQSRWNARRIFNKISRGSVPTERS